MANDFDKLFKDLKKLPREIQKDFGKLIKKDLKKAILDSMKRGISPVRGESWDAYSKAYKDAIKKGVYKNESKKTTPVNLKLSGDLHRSLIVRAVFSGSSAFIEIEFKDDLADIHNRQGAGKKKVVRRMLPTGSGEEFNKEINKVIDDVFTEVVDKNITEFNNS